MKKLMMTVCLFAMTFFALQAQFQIGPKVGMNLANCNFSLEDGDNEPDTKMRLSYAVGIGIDYGFSDAFSIQSGLMYTSKGYSDDLEEGLEDGAEVDGYARYILNFIELPINAVFKMSGFQVYVGPYVAYGLGGKYKWDYTYTYMGIEESDDGEIKIKSFMGEVEDADLEEDETAVYALDYGLNLGLGYQFDKVLINAGYSIGFSNMIPKYADSPDYRDKNKFTNRVITFSLAYMIPLGD
jgi:hypothetical protein